MNRKPASPRCLLEPPITPVTCRALLQCPGRGLASQSESNPRPQQQKHAALSSISDGSGDSAAPRTQDAPPAPSSPVFAPPPRR